MKMTVHIDAPMTADGLSWCSDLMCVVAQAKDAGVTAEIVHDVPVVPGAQRKRQQPREKITQEDALAQMLAASADNDSERGHGNGDDLLIRIIRENLPEFAPVVDAFNSDGEWWWA